MRVLALALVGIAAFATPALAHKPSDAQLHLRPEGNKLVGRLDVAIRDLDGALALDANSDGNITWGELTTAAPRITAYIAGRMQIANAGAACPLTFGTAALVDLSDGAYWAQPVTATCSAEPHDLAITYRLLFDLDAQHRGLVHLDVGDSSQLLIIHNGDPVNAVLGGDPSFVAFVRSGFVTMAFGLEHALFLACLLLPALLRRRDREVVEIALAFAIGFTASLVMSTFGLVRLPAEFAETAVVVSVVAVAGNNLIHAIDTRWALALSLGMVHGFGLSTTLIDAGLPVRQLAVALVGFDFGLQLGQIAIVLVLIAIAYGTRRSGTHRAVLWAGSAAVVVAAAIWSCQRGLA